MPDLSGEPLKEWSWRWFLDQGRSPSWMSTELSSGFFGVTVGLVADEAIESWILTSRTTMLLDEESPDDILPVIAEDRRLPRYYTETADQHRDRLYRAWELYPLAGTEGIIEQQLFEAGFGPEESELLGEWGDPDVDWGDDTFYWHDLGAFVQFRPDAKGPRGEDPPYRTQFWVVFQEGFHPVTGFAVPWGDFIWGDISEGVWGYQGYSKEFEKLVIGIIKKWKPSDHVFRGFTFVVNNIPWGTEDYDWGDTSIIWGGSIEVPVTLT